MATIQTPTSQRTRVLAALCIGAAGLAVLFAIDAFAPALFQDSLPNRAQDGLTLALSVLIESLPFVALGVVLSIVVQVWLPDGVIERILPRAGWARRAVLSLLGMFIPVCECGNVPFARGLLMRGLGPADALAFLVAAPIVNPMPVSAARSVWWRVCALTKPSASASASRTRSRCHVFRCAIRRVYAARLHTGWTAVMAPGGRARGAQPGLPFAAGVRDAGSPRGRPRLRRARRRAPRGRDPRR